MESLSTIILALLTVASPLAISRAKNESWTKTTKVAVPILVSATLAIAYLYITGSITQGSDVITTILMVYGAQQLAYTTIMRWWSSILEQRGQSDDTLPKHAADGSRKASAVAVLAVLALVLSSLPAAAASITYPYTAHVQNVGWQGMVGDGAVAGTTGRALRLEAIRFVFPGQQARGHVQDIGWQAWQVNDSTQVGTTGQSKRLEAIQIRSTIPGVRIECQAHVQGIGWMPRVGAGEVCGTTGKGLRLEAVRFWLVQTP